eukprot:TRINITY_DN32_c0_g6_i3.p3 TRINITY_DN32_c0_g6~~TRINITY_DN32_c0_g6_i3.p3  ORF type:complete len:124 (+),score=1.53 TRINITY_DN32_c0_g6_i3:680-1051(+)
MKKGRIKGTEVCEKRIGKLRSPKKKYLRREKKEMKKELFDCEFVQFEIGIRTEDLETDTITELPKKKKNSFPKESEVNLCQHCYNKTQFGLFSFVSLNNTIDFKIMIIYIYQTLICQIQSISK